MDAGRALGAVPLAYWSAALVLLALFGAWQYRALRTRLAAPGAALLALLRLLSLGLVLLLIAGPRLTQRGRPAAPRPVAFVLDTSQSMGLRGGLVDTRLERVQAFLGSDDFKQLSAAYTPAFFSFSGSVAGVPADALGALRPQGSGSDVAGALAAAGPGQSAVVVFTDGGHGGGGPAREALPDSGVPVVFVGVGGAERTRDVEIAAVDPPAVAFAGQPLTIRVTLRARGFAGREVPLLLRRGGQVLASRAVVLPPDGETREVALEWTPPSRGLHALSLHLPVLDGEQIDANNRAELPLEAVRDRVRVLLVSGSPSWSYRFLREALKGDPSLDVVSFVILRSPSDAPDVPQQDLSLIPFPTQKIFLEELPNFDLLIFDNFPYQPYLPSGYLEKVGEYVRGGGGFWMLGGPFSFLGGRYQSGPLEPLLPVTLQAPGQGGADFVDLPVQPRLTPAGLAHPFFQGLDDRAAPPPLQGYNVSGAARPGAVVLAEAPGAEGRPQPLVVLGRHGGGRVLAVLTDSLWRWSFEEAGRGRGNRAFLAFVRQAVRWSIGDPQLEPVRVELERPRVAPGETLRARVRVLGEDFLPAAKSELTVLLRAPDGTSVALAALPEGTGVYRVEGVARSEGSWEISAAAASRGSVYGRAAASVSAAWPPEEFRSPGLNKEALNAALAGRRGALLELGGPGETARELERTLGELTGRDAADPGEETRPLAETLPVFALLVLLLGAEWLLRRRRGLP